MSQVTIYLASEVEARARREAKRRGTSLSAYIASLLDEPKGRARLDRALGSLPDFTVPDDTDLLPLDEPPSFDE